MRNRIVRGLVMAVALIVCGLSASGAFAQPPAASAAPALPMVSAASVVPASSTPASAQPSPSWLDELTLGHAALTSCNNFCCTNNTQCIQACGDAAACTGSPSCKRCILL